MKPSNLYQVKFQRNGQWRYGIVYSTDKDTIAKWDEGIVCVTDAIRPHSWEIPIDKITPIPLQTGSDFNNEYRQYVESEFQRANEHSKSLSGLQVGSLITIGVADGSAYYVVTKVSKRKCKIEWRGFYPERYTNQFLGWGGSFDKNTITPLIQNSQPAEEVW